MKGAFSDFGGLVQAAVGSLGVDYRCSVGHSLFVVSRALGHSSIQQISRYSHLSDDTLLAAAEAAANAMGANWLEAKKSPG